MIATATTAALAVVWAVQAAPALQNSALNGTRAAKTNVYVVLRMDDTQHSFEADTQAAVLQWAIDHQVKYNIGVISGPPDAGGQPWPTSCAADAGARSSPAAAALCDDPIVSGLNKAYTDGHVLGNPVADAATGVPVEQLIEIFDHSWAHNGWTWPAIASEAFQKQDLARARQALCAAYPNASIRTFVPPTNIANNLTVRHMREHGLDILSSQGTGQDCRHDGPGAASFGYKYSPCQAQDPTVPGSYTCMPPDGQYVKHGGDGTWAPLAGLGGGSPIWSVPTGSANSQFNDDEAGLAVEDTIGGDDECGCVGPATCSIIGGARFNAHYSDGLMWTVLMLHPQTQFDGGKLAYVAWLDELRTQMLAHPKYDFKFVNFQDLAYMKDKTPGAGAAPPAGPEDYVCIPPSGGDDDDDGGSGGGDDGSSIAGAVCGSLFGALVLATGGHRWLRQRSRARAAAAAARAKGGLGDGSVWGGAGDGAGAGAGAGASERLLPAHAPAAHVRVAVEPHGYGHCDGDESRPPGAPPSTGWSLHGRGASEGHSSQGSDSLPPGMPPADMTLTRAGMLPKPKPTPKPPTFTLKTRDVRKYAVGQHVEGVGRDGELSGVVVKLERDPAGRAGVLTVQPPTPAIH